MICNKTTTKWSFVLGKPKFSFNFHKCLYQFDTWNNKVKSTSFSFTSYGYNIFWDKVLAYIKVLICQIRFLITCQFGSDRKLNILLELYFIVNWLKKLFLCCLCVEMFWTRVSFIYKLHLGEVGHNCQSVIRTCRVKY